MAIIISIIALIISLVLAIRLLLLDKDYCEFGIVDEGCDNNGFNIETLNHPELEKNKYMVTKLSPTIQLLKSNIYDVNISDINDKGITLPFKKNKIIEIKEGYRFTIDYYSDKEVNIKITYRDSKNNLYRQILFIKPFYNGNSTLDELSNPKVILDKRKWLIWFSIKRKYF